MTYIGVGNEQWGEQYFERYAVFEKALQDRYPEIKIVSTSGPLSFGPFIEYAHDRLKDFTPALVDEHYYATTDWFFDNTRRYDDYDRDAYKIFVGEYAAASHEMASPENKNTWGCALAEAAYMTGLERNADVVYMASYAPLLAHVDAWQWSPDLIWFDNLSTYRTPSYYVPQLYSANKGSHLLQLKKEGNPMNGEEGLFGTAAWDDQTNELILKLVNRNSEAKRISVHLQSTGTFDENAEIIVLSQDDLDAINTIEQPDYLKPHKKAIRLNGRELEAELDPYSLSVIKIRKE